ncbi:MAG TPA: sugar phosphate isomerase/epimerase [Armatimonadota bacterium]|jgi:sugar phosphate isomerase/epimerase
MTIALQLYTVRDECAKGFPDALRKVAAIGYTAVEMAGLYDMEPLAVKEVLNECGLTAAGSHEGYDGIKQDIDAVIQRNVALGCRNVTCPWVAGTDSADPAFWDNLAVEFNAFGKAFKDAGITFSYHNHAHEFVKVDGQFGLVRLFASTDPELVKVEADVGWVWFAGQDPAAFISNYPGRVPLIHAKDHDREDKNLNRPVGEGALDWKAVLAAAEKIGTEYVVVEEDRTILPAMESVARSYVNLKAMGLS